MVFDTTDNRVHDIDQIVIKSRHYQPTTAVSLSKNLMIFSYANASEFGLLRGYDTLSFTTKLFR